MVSQTAWMFAGVLGGAALLFLFTVWLYMRAVRDVRREGNGLALVARPDDVWYERDLMKAHREAR